MEMLQVLASTFNFGVLKEPRGFIKCLQFLFSICAFATTTSYSSFLRLSVSCDGDGQSPEYVRVPLYYSFRTYESSKKVCEGTKDINFWFDFSSDSQFFVAVGVLAFLYTICAICMYTIFEKLYNSDHRLPLLDFVAHAAFAVLFLAASSAWANSLRALKTACTLETIVQENGDACGKGECEVTQDPDFSKLNISVIFGFLNCFLFGSNLWFIYKETPFFGAKENPEKMDAEQSQPPVV